MSQLAQCGNAASCLTYTAEARLGPGNWIMIDAPSVAEALQQIRVALPGAVGSRVVW